MELKYSAPFVNPLTKEVLRDSTGTAITLQHLLFECATRGLPGDENLPTTDKMALYKIAGQIVNIQELKSADLKLLRERGAKFLSILALGFISDELDKALGS